MAFEKNKEMTEEEIKKIITESQFLAAFFLGRGLSTDEARQVLLFSLTVYILTALNLEVNTDKVSHLMTNIGETIINTLKTYFNESN